MLMSLMNFAKQASVSDVPLSWTWPAHNSDASHGYYQSDDPHAMGRLQTDITPKGSDAKRDPHYSSIVLPKKAELYDRIHNPDKPLTSIRPLLWPRDIDFRKGRPN